MCIASSELIDNSQVLSSTLFVNILSVHHVVFSSSCHFPGLLDTLNFSFQDTVYSINRVTLPVYILVSDVCSVTHFLLEEVDELPEFDSGEWLEVHELLYFLNLFIDCPFVAFAEASQIVTLVQDGSYASG